MDDEYYLNLGEGKKKYFSLPKGWRVRHFLQPGRGKRTSINPLDLLKQALSEPVNSPGLSDLASEVSSVVILVDDHTRPTPVARMLETLCPHLEKGGLKSSEISIVIALGTHSLLTERQLALRVGKRCFSRYPVIQHDCFASDLVPIAKLMDGHEVKINLAAAKADLIVTLSSVLPHTMSGFGGGPKIIMPGIADFESIKVHHITNAVHTNAKLGKTAGNPFYEETMNVARSAGRVFSVNCLYDEWGEINDIVAGDLEAAFEKGAARSISRLGHRFESEVDVTVTSSFPHVSGPQVIKAFAAPSIVTKKGGVFLIYAPLSEPMPAAFLSAFVELREKSGDHALKFIRESLSKGTPILPNSPMDFNMAVMMAFIRTSEATAILASDLVSKKQAHLMGFEYASSLEEGLNRVEELFPDADVAIFPSGGFVVPFMDLGQS